MNEQERLAKAVEQSINAVASALRPLAPQLDADPSGVEQVALVAVLLSYAELLSEELPKEAEEAITALRKVITQTLKAPAQPSPSQPSLIGLR